MVERFALDGYLVEELIGFGGSGEVWRARQADSGDTVALKRLRVRGAAATERLRREAALLATMAGPHVIAVRRLLVEGDEAVLVMDFAAGGSLAGVLAARGMLPAAEVVTVLAPIAAALAAAHARDLVHGDLSPANILFAADGRPLLADFGVAQAVGASATGVARDRRLPRPGGRRGCAGGAGQRRVRPRRGRLRGARRGACMGDRDRGPGERPGRDRHPGAARGAGTGCAGAVGRGDRDDAGARSR